MDYPAELIRLNVYIYPGWPVTLCLLESCFLHL